MLWLFILIIVLIGCFTCYKVGEFHELHNIRAEFDDFLKHCARTMDLFEPGIEAAKKIVDDTIKKEKTLWKE